MAPNKTPVTRNVAKLETHFTSMLGIANPIVLAPMAFSSHAELVAAVVRAGGLGLIGV
ncbi:hypothetical protein HDU93_005104, partial [Gonapodya sp. JEL0774]